MRVSTTFNIVWPAPFYRGSSASALRGPPRLSGVRPGSVPACCDRAGGEAGGD